MIVIFLMPKSTIIQNNNFFNISHMYISSKAFVLFCSSSMILDDSSKKNYVNVWEAASNSFPIMKMIGGLNWKKNKKRTASQELLTPMADDGVDETDNYTTIRSGVPPIPVRPEQQTDKGCSKAVIQNLQNGIKDLVFSDKPPVVTFNSQNHPQPENSVSSLDG